MKDKTTRVPEVGRTFRVPTVDVSKPHAEDLALRQVQLTERATGLRQLGKLKEALACYQESLRCAVEVDDERSTGADYGNIGGILFEMGQLDAAEDALRKAISVDTKYGQRVALGYHFYYLALIAAKRRLFGTAHDYATQYLAHAESDHDRREAEELIRAFSKA